MSTTKEKNIIQRVHNWMGKVEKFLFNFDLQGVNGVPLGHFFPTTCPSYLIFYGLYFFDEKRCTSVFVSIKSLPKKRKMVTR